MKDRKTGVVARLFIKGRELGQPGSAVVTEMADSIRQRERYSNPAVTDIELQMETRFIFRIGMSGSDSAYTDRLMMESIFWTWMCG